MTLDQLAVVYGVIAGVIAAFIILSVVAYRKDFKRYRTRVKFYLTPDNDLRYDPFLVKEYWRNNITARNAANLLIAHKRRSTDIQ